MTAEQLIRDDKVKGFNAEGRESGLFLLRCHQCDVRGAFTAGEVTHGPRCRTCFPDTPYPARPPKNPTPRHNRPEDADLSPKTHVQKFVVHEIEACLRTGRPIHTGDIARLAGVKSAYVEKVYFKNYLVPKLLARIEELEKGRRESA